MHQTLRSLLKTPGFTAIAVITLALGIGANTAIFSVVNGVLLRPLPYPHADRIVEVWVPTREEPKGAHSPADFLAFQRRNQTLSHMAGVRIDPVTVAVSGRDPVGVAAGLVTIDFFEILGMPAALGRTFSSTAGDLAAGPLAVIGHDLWRTTLGSDAGIVGQLLRINGVPHTVLGVMPEAFDHPREASVWVLSSQPVPPPPMKLPGDLLEMRDVQYFLAMGRVAEGATVAQAQADLAAIAADLAQKQPRTNAHRGALVQPLHEGIVADVRGALMVLLGAVSVVLLIACANVASLTLARASGRQRELAVRSALGASRGRLIRQLLAESLLLAAGGGVVGLLLGMWTVALLVDIMPAGIPRIEQIRLDWRVAAAALAVSGASAVLFGLLPALQASRTDPSAILHAGGDRSSTGGRRRARTRSGIVVAEVALTVILLVAAALLANSFIRLQATDPGFEADDVVLISAPLPQARYPDRDRQVAFYDRLLEALARRGELTTAAVAFPRPLNGDNASGHFTIEGRAGDAGEGRPHAAIASVSPDYLRTVGIPLLAGRHFTSRDRRPLPTPVIVNTALARRYFDNENPLGRRLRFDDAKDEWMTIVGVAADSRNMGLDADPYPLLYFPNPHFQLPFMEILVRTRGGAETAAAAVREELRAIDPDLPLGRVMPLAETLHRSVAQPRFRALLLGAFAVTALLLATVGVYGLISYSVSQRTREIGIRVALGAQPRQVLGTIVREGMLLALAGVAIGIAGAAVATRWLSTLLFGVRPSDPATFAAVGVLLMMVALLASYLPSRRALRIDALAALKTE